ncbi:MAG: PH domain-containing protein [Promethearchaeota archaeon]
MTKDFQYNPSIFLLPDERIILRANPHWLFLALPLIGIFFFFLFYLFFACPFLRIIYQGIENACYIVSLFIFFFLSIIFYLDWKFNRLYLTNMRLIKERGIIGKRFMAIKLDNIEDISCSYGIWGRIFGYGDLIIESAGTYGKMVFKGMPSPLKIKWKIENERHDPISRDPL